MACKSAGDEARIEVDFLINNEELESLGFEYDEEDFSLYKNDPDKVYFTTVNEQVEFKDITIPVTENKRKWYLDNKEWKAEKVELRNLPTFTHTFETPGLYKVKLVINDLQKVTKFVRVLDKSNDARLVDASKSKSKSQSLFEKEASSAQRDIGDFEVFDFVVSKNNPEKWEAIVFEDVSKTDQKITKRFWDFGDGTIIPTKGSKVKYSYARSGVYEVKMCVNMTNNCKRKRITVSEPNLKEDNLLAKASTKNKAEGKENTTTESVTALKSTVDSKNAPSKKRNTNSAAILQNLGFDLPTKVQAGLPVRMKDFSFPDEAINSRSWYIDGVKQYFHQRTVNYIFDSPGTFEIKMCLNKKKDQCVIKKINVYQNEVVKAEEIPVVQEVEFEKPEPEKKIEYIPVVSKPSKGFMCQSYGKAGLKSKYKCTTDREYHYGNAIVNITPSLDIELQNAEIYGESDGYMDVMLLDDSFTEIGRIKNVQVLPGYSTIEFADLAFTLEKGKKYSILLKPKSTKKKKIGLENANGCKVPAYYNEDLKVEYQGTAFVMYDIKYCF